MARRWKVYTGLSLALMLVLSGCEGSGKSANDAVGGKLEPPGQATGKSSGSDTTSKPADSASANAGSTTPAAPSGGSAAKTDKPLRYDPFTVKAGDQLGSWKVTNVKGSKPNEEVFYSYVDYTGEAEVSGHFTVMEKNAEFLAEQVYFTPLTDSANLIPNVYAEGKVTDRSIMFVFANQDEARKAFGEPGSRGVATIKIADYKTQYAPTEIWDTAKLVQVVKKETPTVDLDYVKKYARIGMPQNEVIDWFGPAAGIDQSKGDAWHFDYAGGTFIAPKTVLEKTKSPLPDIAAIEKGTLSMQLVAGWTEDNKLEYLDAYTKNADGKVEKFTLNK